MTMPRSGPRRGLARPVLHDHLGMTRGGVAIKFPRRPAHRGAAGAVRRGRAPWRRRGLWATGWQNYAPRYGAEGYRLEGARRTAGSVIVYDSALIELTVGHQLIRFRAFLLNGGV